VPLYDTEAQARRELVAAARAMLSGELPYVEGAFLVTRLRHRISGVAERDEDFDAFVVIESETDHLPLQAQRPLWSEQALAGLEPEFKRTQEWAASFAADACKRLIARFEHS
jgi:hypothetical protein